MTSNLVDILTRDAHRLPWHHLPEQYEPTYWLRIGEYGIHVTEDTVTVWDTDDHKRGYRTTPELWQAIRYRPMDHRWELAQRENRGKSEPYRRHTEVEHSINAGRRAIRYRSMERGGRS